MLGKRGKKRGVGFAVVGLGAKINGEFICAGFDDFCLRRARFYFNLINRHFLNYIMRDIIKI